MYKSIRIPKVSQAFFLKKIKEHKLENMTTINTIEHWLNKKRGFVFKMPPANTSVIISFSGGLDSTVLAALLLQKYKLILYPFYVADQPRSKIEIKRAKKIIKYFQKKYPSRIMPLICYEGYTGEWAYRNTELDFTNRFLVNAVIDIRQQLSLLHSQYVFQNYGVNATTMFCGIQYHDGNFNPAQTLTGLRATLFNMCIKTNRYDWQFASLFLEKELGFLLEKTDLIKIGAALNLPLELTWSCFRSGRFHCGKCGNCYVRRESFYKAKIKDKTIYGSILYVLLNQFIRVVRYIKRHLHSWLLDNSKT
jgi:7-cyano-7-deazaguanine synthase in queuosine biosynthesis